MEKGSRLELTYAAYPPLPQGDKSTYIGRRADLYGSDDKAI